MKFIDDSININISSFAIGKIHNVAKRNGRSYSDQLIKILEDYASTCERFEKILSKSKQLKSPSRS